MKDWGLSHRFAGSGDRAAISSLVYDALRKKSSSAWIMGEASPRAEMLGALRQTRGLDVDGISALFSGEGHAPMKLAEAERARLASADLSGAPPHVFGRFSGMARRRSSRRASGRTRRKRAGRSPSGRRSTSARTSLKSRATRRLPRLPISLLQPTPLSPVGLRIAMRPDGRGPPLASEPAYVKGLVEVQDEGSQLAALIADAKPGMQVLDLCAGAGGKTLALAASMQNHGQIYAADSDPRRLAPIFTRLARSGARNVQVRAPRGHEEVLADLEGRCDLVLIDAPCTGSGAWRRNPDAKWRIRPGALEQRIKDQDETLENALRFVKRSGRIVYVTCSVIRAENEDRIAEFMKRHDDLLPVDADAQARAAGLPALAEHRSTLRPRLSPQPEGDWHGRLLCRDARADVRPGRAKLGP